MSSEVKNLETEIPSAVSTEGRGILFVVSAPSGAGKGTLIQRVLNNVPNLSYSVSFTTRPPRSGEVNGREYFFVSKDQFEQMVAAGDFLEWAHVHSHSYGTSRGQVASEISGGRDIILEVDVQGAASVRQLISDSVSIFILPPSFEVLRQRLLARGTDSLEELDVRLRNAPRELEHYSAFQYLIINDDADRAASDLRAVIQAERARLSRQESQIKKIVNAFTASEINSNSN